MSHCEMILVYHFWVMCHFCHQVICLFTVEKVCIEEELDTYTYKRTLCITFLWVIYKKYFDW